MNKELRDLLGNLDEAEQRMATLREENKIKEAHAMLEEIRSIEQQIEVVKQLEKRSENANTKKDGHNKMEKRNVLETMEYRQAFIKFISKQEESMTVEERNAFGTGQASGGAVVPTTLQNSIYTFLKELSPMRQLASVIMSGSNLVIAMEGTNATAKWVSEGGEITASPVALGKVEFNAHKLATLVKISNELIADAVVDIEQYVAEQVATAIAELEGDAFINGDGVGKPTGIMTGVAIKKTIATLGYDTLVDAVHAVAPKYRVNGSFLVSDAVFASLMKLKDNNGRPLIVVDMTKEVPYSFLGKSIFVEPKLADKKIFFGDFKRGYQIIDRNNMTIRSSQERYMEFDQTGVVATKRVDAKVLDTKALAHITITTV